MKTVIFDFDGTIGDSLPVGIEIVNELAEKYGYKKVDPKEVPRLQKMRMAEILKEWDVSVPKSLFVGREVLKMFALRLEKVSVFNGIKETIQKLIADGYEVGIITKNDTGLVARVLKREGISVDFLERDKTVFGKEKVINQVIRDKGLSKSDVVYIGDELRDIDASRKADIPIISVAWGYNSKEVLSQNNSILVDKPSQLENEIKKILG